MVKSTSKHRQFDRFSLENKWAIVYVIQTNDWHGQHGKLGGIDRGDLQYRSLPVRLRDPGRSALTFAQIYAYNGRYAWPKLLLRDRWTSPLVPYVYCIMTTQN